MGLSTLKCRDIPRRRPFSRLGRMPRFPQSSLALALALAAGLGLVACGGEDAKLLPGETAREITANLDTVQQLSGEGDCVGADSAAQQVGEQIEALEGVDPKLKRVLEDGAARLEEVIAGCEESSSEAVGPASTPTEPDESEEKGQKAKEGRGKEEAAPETTTTSPSQPPQADGEGNGLENGSGPPGEEGSAESPSGGVSPGSPAGEGE